MYNRVIVLLVICFAAISLKAQDAQETQEKQDSDTSSEMEAVDAGEIRLDEVLPAADELPYGNWSWQEDPELADLTEEERDAKAAVLLDFRSFEYTYDADELVINYTEHKRIRVNQLTAVEEYNKFIIPVYGTMEVLEMRARTISPVGKVQELDASEIREVDNLENAGAFKLFAVEGLQPGGEVEYRYVLKKSPVAFGRELFQEDIPVREAVFELSSPRSLEFKVRSYNDFPNCDFVEQDEDESRRVMRGVSKNLPARFSEKYANYRPHLQRIEYKLAYNRLSAPSQLYTWSDAAYRYYDLVYSYDKQAAKAMKKELSKLKLGKLSNDNKIKAIEEHLKTNFQLQDGDGPDFEEVAPMLLSRFANELGMIRLFAAALQVAEIEHELVLTSDRKEFPFDPDFNSWNYLDELFFYFPRHETFLAPEFYEYRYGLIPYEWRDNYALFVAIPVDKDGMLKERIDYIPDVNVADHHDDIEINVNFPDKMSGVDLKVKRTLSGYRANFIQPYYDLLPPETQKEFVEAFLKSSGEDAKIASSKVSNTTSEAIYASKPIIIEGELSSQSLLEKAGRRYLFKLGDVIGAQVEMYQERERQFQIDVEYPHRYLRTIKIQKPEGYTFKGLEDINIDIRYADQDGNAAMGFVSGYTETDTEIIVEIDEYYNYTNYPKNAFEEFREVINAAADFNKVTLVMEKVN